MFLMLQIVAVHEISPLVMIESHENIYSFTRLDGNRVLPATLEHFWRVAISPQDLERR
jgi:hypothetical protein